MTTSPEPIDGEEAESPTVGGDQGNLPAPLRALDVKPALVMTAAESLARLDELKTFVREVMIEGEDYGPMPGGRIDPKTGKGVLVLLQPGAQKLLEIYGYYAEPEIVEKIEDWGEIGPDGVITKYPFWSYNVRVNIVSKRTGNVVSAGFGACNSREKKYLWRDAALKCPFCEKENIRVSKNPKPGEYYYCWKKTGGCGAQFGQDTPAIVNQKVGRTLNPEPFDLQNTILKMAVKRAVVAGAIAATRSAMLFTQDLEPADDGSDYTPEDQMHRIVAPGERSAPPRGAVQYKDESPGQVPTMEQLQRLKKYCDELAINAQRDADHVWIDFPATVFTQAWGMKDPPEDRMLTVWVSKKARAEGEEAQVTADLLARAFSHFETAFLNVHGSGVQHAQVTPPPPGEPF
jgi:hypothetical protein